MLLAWLGLLCGRGARRPFAIGALLLLLSLALFVPGVNQLFRLPAIQNVWPMRWLVHGTLLWACLLYTSDAADE